MFSRERRANDLQQGTNRNPYLNRSRNHFFHYTDHDRDYDSEHDSGLAPYFGVSLQSDLARDRVTDDRPRICFVEDYARRIEHFFRRGVRLVNPFIRQRCQCRIWLLPWPAVLIDSV